MHRFSLLELELRLWMGCQVWLLWHPGNPVQPVRHPFLPLPK